MAFYTYMLCCSDGSYYTGHTEDLEVRLAQHRRGALAGYTQERRPVELVWCADFPTRDEALAAERRIRGWGRGKKEALIAGDWARISVLARNRQGECPGLEAGSGACPSTGSGRTGVGKGPGPGDLAGALPPSVRPELVEGHAHNPTTSRQAPLPLRLTPHPAARPSAIRAIAARCHWAGPGTLALSFRVSGAIEKLILPPPAPPQRRDGLWQTTCFELFAELDGGYLEYNVSPGTEWAAYRFTGYREGMAPLDGIAPPTTEQHIAPDQYEIDLRLHLPAAAPVRRIGITAVIEEAGGAKSYWALAHPAGKPDFHDPACFALELPAATRA